MLSKKTNFKVIIHLILWFSGLVFCVSPYIFAFVIYPIQLIATSQALGLKRLTPNGSSAHIVGLLASLSLLAFYCLHTWEHIRHLRLNIKKMFFLKPHIPLIIVLVFLISLTGLFHTFLYSNSLRSLTVGTLYTLGFFGLLFLRASTKQKNTRAQLTTFTVGFTFVLIAFAILEILFKLGF